jgi:hypothetical protein
VADHFIRPGNVCTSASNIAGGGCGSLATSSIVRTGSRDAALGEKLAIRRGARAKDFYDEHQHSAGLPRRHWSIVRMSDRSGGRAGKKVRSFWLATAMAFRSLWGIRDTGRSSRNGCPWARDDAGTSSRRSSRPMAEIMPSSMDTSVNWLRLAVIPRFGRDCPGKREHARGDIGDGMAERTRSAFAPVVKWAAGGLHDQVHGWVVTRRSIWP